MACCHSASTRPPIIFNTVANALEWIFWQPGVEEIDHCLDNFITMRPLGSRNLDTIFQACDELGLPLVMEKLEGPTMCLIILGIEIDTTSGLMRLPEEKLACLHQALQSWA